MLIISFLVDPKLINLLAFAADKAVSFLPKATTRLFFSSSALDAYLSKQVASLIGRLYLLA